MNRQYRMLSTPLTAGRRHRLARRRQNIGASVSPLISGPIQRPSFPRTSPYALISVKHTFRATHVPRRVSSKHSKRGAFHDESPGESPDDSSDESSGEPPEESGNEWSGDPPEESGDESDESPETSSKVASRKRARDEDFDEPVAKRTNKMSEPSEDSDVVESHDDASAAFDETKATANAKKLTVPKLRAALGALDQIKTGLKPQLVVRLVDAQRAASVPVRKSNVTPPSTPSTRRPRRRSGVPPLI